MLIAVSIYEIKYFLVLFVMSSLIFILLSIAKTIKQQDIP